MINKVQEKYAAFQKACKDHVEYLQTASNGMGCDRHLLGLKLCMKPGESHELYNHPIYAKSSHWQLSTSGLIPSDYLQGSGFGSVYPDGYGMNYMLAPKMIKIGIESKYECIATSTLKYADTLSRVLDDVKDMCDAVNTQARL